MPTVPHCRVTVGLSRRLPQSLKNEMEIAFYCKTGPVGPSSNAGKSISKACDGLAPAPVVTIGCTARDGPLAEIIDVSVLS